MVEMPADEYTEYAPELDEQPPKPRYHVTELNYCPYYYLVKPRVPELAIGEEAHRLVRERLVQWGYQTEHPIVLRFQDFDIVGIVDGVSFTRREIIEVKSMNVHRDHIRQLLVYVAMFKRKYGGDWTPILGVYKLKKTEDGYMLERFELNYIFYSEEDVEKAYNEILYRASLYTRSGEPPRFKCCYCDRCPERNTCPALHGGDEKR